MAPSFLKNIKSLSVFFVRTKILRQRVPLLASFKLLYQCNLSCRVCPYHLRKNEENSCIDFDSAIKVLDHLKKLGCQIIVFEGGEPLMWKDGTHSFSELVSYAKEKFMCTAVTTNGTFMLDVPTDIVWVSIDGTREIHDGLRSESFDRVLENIRNTSHKKVFVHFTANKTNHHDIEKLFIELNKTHNIKGITLQLVYPYNQGEEDLSLSYDERRAVIEKAIKLKKEGIPVLNSTSRLKAMIDNTWKCHDGILINVDPDASITSGCYVKNRGEVYCKDCGFTPVAEASGALDLLPGSILAGWKIFLKSY
jgi:MoaA/NifB/PqqE/SkfB family radical SAM enzyme